MFSNTRTHLQRRLTVLKPCYVFHSVFNTVGPPPWSSTTGTRLTCFQLLSTTTRFNVSTTLSLTRTYFQSFLFILDCCYSFTTVFTQFRVTPFIFIYFFIIFGYFHSFSAIFNHFLSSFTILTRTSLPSISHFRRSIIILTHFNRFPSYIYKHKPVFDCYYHWHLYLTVNVCFWFPQRFIFLYLFSNN